MASESAHQPLLSDFPVVIALPVFWGDQDAFGHVNNKVTFRWFESARIEYFERIGLTSLHASERIGPILASTACDFRRQLNFPDTVHVGISAVRIGRTSLGLKHAVVSERQQAIACEGTSTVVIFDYRENRSHPVPPAVRQAIADLEGRAFE
jgi:acyl-CoA thioester hydrolase